MALSAAERSKKYRQKQNHDFKEKERLRKTKFRAARSAKKIRADKLATKERVRQYRLNKKLQDNESATDRNLLTPQALSKAISRVRQALPTNNDKKMRC